MSRTCLALNRKLHWVIWTGLNSIFLKQKADKSTHNFMQAVHIYFCLQSHLGLWLKIKPVLWHFFHSGLKTYLGKLLRALQKNYSLKKFHHWRFIKAKNRFCSFPWAFDIQILLRGEIIKGLIGWGLETNVYKNH